MPPLLCHDIFISIYQVMIVLGKENNLRLNLQKLPTGNAITTWKVKLTSEATGESKEGNMVNTSWDERSLTASFFINLLPVEVLETGRFVLKDPKYPAGFYIMQVTADDGDEGAYIEHLRCYAYLEREEGQEGYHTFDDYTETRTYNAYEQ